MSIQSEINRISQNVSDSLTAVAAKGVTVPTGSTSDDLPDLIAAIPSGGGGGIVITDTTDSHGGTIREITAVEISGTKTIVANGTGIDVTEYAAVNVAVPSEEPTLQAKTNISPSTSSQTITPDNGYDGLSSVQINAMPSGTAGTPTATKGSVSNHSVSVTPSVTNTTGYITGSTKTGTAVTVSASELVSGNLAISSNGTNIDVANYSTVSVDVSAASKNFQVSNSQVRLNNKTALTDTGLTLTVGATGTYNVYWSCFRTNTSSGYTWGSQLYIGSTSYGSENTTWSNSYNQINKLTSVSLTKDQVLHIYGRTRSGTSYYICCSNLIIEQTS